jgi:uncharacterized membrane protein YcfT
MSKSAVVAFVDAVFVFVALLLAQYLPAIWADALKSLLVAVQPVVVYFICKWLNIEQLRALKLLK